MLSLPYLVVVEHFHGIVVSFSYASRSMFKKMLSESILIAMEVAVTDQSQERVHRNYPSVKRATGAKQFSEDSLGVG